MTKRRFGLIGKDINYSFSPSFFTTFFDKNELAASYELCDIPSIDEVSSLFSSDYSGFNVTIPYKESIIPFLDEIDPTATAIGAVNVVAFKEGKTIGYNTDAFGFHQSIKPFLTFQHERALLLGTGGASKAVEFVFKQIGLDVIHISRNPNDRPKFFSYEDINEHMLRACKVVVNCTPMGTFPNIDKCPDFPFEFLTEEHLIIDLIYNPAKTKFLENAQNRGATILNGESMLREQALKSWEIWNQ